MPYPTPGDQIDTMTGNGKKLNFALSAAALALAAALGLDVARLKKKEAQALERAAKNKQNASDALAGKPIKGKGKGKEASALAGNDIYNMFGEDRNKFAEEPQLQAPNATRRGMPSF